MEWIKIFTVEYEIIGRKVAYYRALNRFSQAQLAKKIGISVSYLSKIECANVESISLSTLLLIAKGLNVPAYLLIKFDEGEALLQKRT